MNAPLTKLVALAGLCLLLSGCAQTGAPLPPSLELPKPPTDLRATRKGSRVTLTWSEPALTTDHQSVRYLGPTLICRGADPEMTVCGNPVEIVPPPSANRQTSGPQKSLQRAQAKPPVPQTYTDTIPPSLQSDNPDDEITYAVEVLNRNARGAGLSNRVRVPAIATMPAPNDPAATLTANGVVLTWTASSEPPAKPGVEHRYRVYRQIEIPGENTSPGKNNHGKDTIAGEIPVGEAGPAHFLDSIEWEKIYLYWITAVTIIRRPDSEVQVEGDDSPMVRVVAHDVFPPPVPAGLQAAYSGEGQKPFIDLIWAPVTSADLAGYNVYRSEANGTPRKLNSELVKSPSYRDTEVTSGETYVYSVSAVDVRGNESARSEEASESVP
ncbi:MAG: hypothetical protein WA172_16430 [Terriglobales bacterium]